ncbi:MAG: Gldg family protein [Candidatus Omnitrophica bacterium]|nr:Gldg family protein [Candidatus Omnitrophota bacterium]
MKQILVILKRELNSYFNSAIAYIYLIVFIVINNLLFMSRYFLIGKAEMTFYFNSLPFILFIFIPAITMRLWAEERKHNTFELLLTFPLRSHELVLGKFFASLIFYLIALLSTITVPITLYLTGKPDLGAILSGYLGSFMIGMFFLAIGIFISGLTKEQIVAFVLTTLSCFIFFFIGTDFFAFLLDGWFAGLGTFIKNYIGSAVHFNSFNRGVVDLRDIIYFSVTTSVFLLLNGFFLETRLKPKSKVFFSLAVVICIVGVVIFNWLVNDLLVIRLDLTENKVYTISKITKKVFKELKAPVRVNLYITPSEKMPTFFKTLEQDIVGKLEELKIASGNKFIFKVFHIEAAKLLEEKKTEETALEKIIQDKGILPFQVESIDKDEIGVKLVYSALTIAYKEKKEEVLPRILPQNLPDLEYLILSRIMKLTTEKKPKVAIFAPLKPLDVSPELMGLLANVPSETKTQYKDEYETLVPLMRNNGYDVLRINLSEDDHIPAQTDTLLIINPGSLNERQLYEINKFLYQGGSVMIAAQGYEYSIKIAPPQGIEITPQSLNLDINKLIKKWGVGINTDMLMDENSQIIEVTSGQRVGPFALAMPVKAPNQISVSPSQMNDKMPFMLRLPSLLYLWGSCLDISEDIIKREGLSRSVMFTSSERSWKVAPYFGSLKKESLVFPQSGSEGRFVLGVMLEGQFSNTFKDKDLPSWPKKEEKEKKIEKAEMTNPRPAKLIVIGCAKMFNDDLIRNQGNLGLFSNIVDGLTLGTEIIQLRTKSYVSRDIKKLSDNQKVFYRFLTIIFVPIILVLYAGLRLFLRQKERQFYLMVTRR